MKWSGSVCELTKAELRALAAFCSRDEGWEHIHQVRFWPALGRAAATDGHSLLVLDAAEPGEGAEFGITRELGEWLAKQLGAREVARLGWGAEEGKLTATVPVVPAPLVLEPQTAEFPPVDEIVPAWREERWTTTRSGFDAHLLARLVLVQDALGTDGLDFQGCDEDPGSPTLWGGESWDGTKATVVVMPFRTTSARMMDDRIRHGEQKAACARAEEVCGGELRVREDG